MVNWVGQRKRSHLSFLVFPRHLRLRQYRPVIGCVVGGGRVQEPRESQPAWVSKWATVVKAFWALGKTDTRAAGIDDGYRFCQATAQLVFIIVLVFCDAQYSVNYFMIHGNLTMMKVGLFLVLNACFSLIAWNGDCYGFTGGSREFTLSHVDTIICYYLLLLSVVIIIIIKFFFFVSLSPQ